MWIHSSPTRFEPGDWLLPRSMTGARSAGYPCDLAHAEELGHIDATKVNVVWSADLTLLPGNLGFADRFVYEVAPEGDLGVDPEPGWSGQGSRTCSMAAVISILRAPFLPSDVP